MKEELDEYRLEDIALDHRIGAGIFIPFVIARLRRESSASEVILTVTLRDIGNSGERKEKLRLFWDLSSAAEQVLSVRLSQVAADGDRFDYWVSDGENEYGLEVSGTNTNEVENRHRAKIRQFRKNPYGVDGYVIVA